LLLRQDLGRGFSPPPG